jgi:hypothetical protein
MPMPAYAGFGVIASDCSVAPGTTPSSGEITCGLSPPPQAENITPNPRLQARRLRRQRWNIVLDAVDKNELMTARPAERGKPKVNAR